MRRVLSETDLRGFRDRVCAAAAELLAEPGYDGFNMRELAARLGVSAMTTYRYFDSKHEIFAALRVQGFSRLADRLENILDLSALPQARIFAFCRGYVDFARDEPVRYRIMFDHPQIARSEELADAERRILQAILVQVHLFAKNGRLDAAPERAARNLWASLHGLVSLMAISAFDEAELEELILDMIGRIAGQNAGAHESGQAPPASAANWQVNWADQANSTSIGWLPVAAAD